MWQREAVRVQFKKVERNNLTSYAIRPFVGGVNCISRETARPSMSHRLRQLNSGAKKQDYIVVDDNVSSVQHLDGIAVAPGIVRQLVALPIQCLDSIEWQMTGLNDVGGLQLEIVPQFRRNILGLYRGDDMNRSIPKWNGRSLSAPEDFGMCPGMLVYREANVVHPRTLLDELNLRDSQDGDRLTFRLGNDHRVTVEVWYRSKKILFKIGIYENLTLIIAKVFQIHGISSAVCCLFFNGDVVRDHDTALDLEMKDGDIIEVHQHVEGGGFSRHDIVWDLSSLEAPGIGFGAGAQIHQSIRRDKEDPRSWDVDAAKLLNVQIFNSQVFKQILGIPLPPTPITFAAYSQADIPIFQRYLEEQPSIHGNFNRVVGVDEAEETNRRVTKPKSSLLHDVVPAETARRSGDPDNIVVLRDVDPRWKSFESVVDLGSLTIND